MPAQLPFVLAGPILRRVDPRRVSVWIALSVPATVTLKVWLNQQQAGDTANSVESGEEPVATGSLQTVAFGRALHVAVVTAKAEAAPLRAGVIYSYGLGFEGDGVPSDLRTAGLLTDEKPDSRLPGVHPMAPLTKRLGYDNDGQLPSFVLSAETIAGLKLVHGSCRKPHAYGPDALAWLDDEIGRTRGDPLSRPQQLFLTGDQIYADDVAGALLQMLSGLGTDLQNGTDVDAAVVHERLTLGGTPTSPGQDIDAHIANFPVARRAKVLQSDAKFTTSDAENHLLTFREYAAMYLAVWSPRVWRPLPVVLCGECGWSPDDRPWSEELCLSPGPKPARPGSGPICKLGVTEMLGALGPDTARPDVLTQPELCSDHPSVVAWTRDEAPKLARQWKEVMNFRSTVPKVARALANVPTYMIFDDHEVTDDWNISRDWITNVNRSAFGRAILRNGLLAYGIFQGWGNDPDTFAASGDNAAFLTEAAKVLAPNHHVPAADTAALDQCLGLGAEPDATKQIKWHYQLPGIKHHTVVLDTRTRRGFPNALPTPASLLGESLKTQLPAGTSAPPERELLLLVSPVPVLGPSIIEQIAQPLADAVHDVKLSAARLDYSECNPTGQIEGRFVNDVESWAANELAFEEFIARVATHPRVVILSGDVHYGTSLSLDYWKGGKDEAASRIVQLTASALHNPAAKSFLPIVRTHGLLQGVLPIPSRVRLGWEGLSPIVVPGGAAPGIGRLVRMKQRPSIVPADGWPAGTSIPADKKPDWAWQITPARDPRPREDLDLSIQPAKLVGGELTITAGDTDPDPLLEEYARVAARHSTTALTFIEHTRMIIFESNIGLVGFTGATDEIVVTHTLKSAEDRASALPIDVTVHVLPLARAPEHPELTHG